VDQVVVEVLEVTDHQFLVSHLVEVVLLNHYLQLQFARLIVSQSEVVHQVGNHPLHQDHKVMMVVIQYLQTLQPLSHQQVVEVVVHQEMVQPLEDLGDQVVEVQRIMGQHIREVLEHLIKVMLVVPQLQVVE
jgi:hypothetical protein